MKKSCGSGKRERERERERERKSEKTTKNTVHDTVFGGSQSILFLLLLLLDFPTELEEDLIVCFSLEKKEEENIVDER